MPILARLGDRFKRNRALGSLNCAKYFHDRTNKYITGYDNKDEHCRIINIAFSLFTVNARLCLSVRIAYCVFSFSVLVQRMCLFSRMRSTRCSHTFLSVATPFSLRFLCPSDTFLSTRSLRCSSRGKGIRPLEIAIRLPVVAPFNRVVSFLASSMPRTSERERRTSRIGTGDSSETLEALDSKVRIRFERP